MESQVLRVEEAAQVLSIGRTACWNAIKRGELRAIRIGGSVRVPIAAVEQLLANGQHHKEVIK